jgi:hypothetical protein
MLMENDLTYKTQDDDNANYISMFESSEVHSNMSLEEILNKTTWRQDNNIFIDYKIMRLFLNKNTYDVFFQNLRMNTIEMLKIYKTLNMHVYLKTLSISDVDKHKDFVFRIVKSFSEEFPNILENAFLYKAPGIFSQIYKIISIAIDSVTKKKIHLVKGKN